MNKVLLGFLVVFGITLLLIFIDYMNIKKEDLSNKETLEKNDSKIQNDIMYTLKNKNINRRLINTIDTFLEYNDYNRYIYDDKDILQYLKEKNPELIDFYNNIDVGVIKADFFRFLYIYNEGGVYSDIDIEFYDKLEIDKDADFFAYNQNKMKELTSHFFGAKRHNKVVKKTLELCIENIKNKKGLKGGTAGKISNLCGPQILTYVFLKEMNIEKSELNEKNYSSEGEKYQIKDYDKAHKVVLRHKATFSYYLDTLFSGQSYWGVNPKNFL